MFEPLLVAYFIQQFQSPISQPFRPDRSYEHVRTVEGRGNLTVEASSHPSGTVPPGSQRVPMLQLLLSADCTDDVVIHTISVQRRGLGLSSDIEAIYALHHGARVSNARQISRRDGLIDINLRRFTVPKCSQEEMTIYADFSQTAAIAGEHRIELISVDAGKATVRIDRKLGSIRPPQTTAGAPIGQISVDYLDINERIHYGSRQRVTRFTLAADNRDDHLVKAITFTNNGSARDEDLQNLFIEFRNRKVSTTARTMDDDTVRLEFDPPFALPKNETLKFSLRADIRASRSRTLQFVIEEPSDIEAMPDRGRR